GRTAQRRGVEVVAVVGGSPNLQRIGASPRGGISTTTPSPETYPAFASLATSEEPLHAASRGARASRLPPSRSVVRRFGPGRAPLHAAGLTIECQKAGRVFRLLTSAGDWSDRSDHPPPGSRWMRSLCSPRGCT